MANALFTFGLVVPPVLAFSLKRKGSAFFLGLLWFWGMMVASAEYAVATDPGYDSKAPALMVYGGWALGAIWCLPWYFVAWGIKTARDNRTRRAQHTSDPTKGQPPDPPRTMDAAGRSDGGDDG